MSGLGTPNDGAWLVRDTGPDWQLGLIDTMIACRCHAFRTVNAAVGEVLCGEEVYRIASNLPGWVPHHTSGMNGERIVVDGYGMLSGAFSVIRNEFIEPTIFYMGTSIGRIVDSYDDVPWEIRDEMQARDRKYAEEATR